jgi:hypothetical protein
MATTFLEFSRPTMMPGGGIAAGGESIGFDSVANAAFISSVLASGAAVAGSAPVSGSMDLPVPVAPVRVKIVGATTVGATIYGNGEIASFDPVTAANLEARNALLTSLAPVIPASVIAQGGSAVAN